MPTMELYRKSTTAPKSADILTQSTKRPILDTWNIMLMHKYVPNFSCRVNETLSSYCERPEVYSDGVTHH